MGLTKVYHIFGILSVIAAFVFIFISIIYSPWFSFWNNWLSDLGVGEAGIIFNTGLVIAGFFCILFSFSFKKYLKCFLLLTSAFLIGVGAFPENIKPFHFYFSVLFFAFSILSMIVAGMLYRERMKYFFFLLAIISICAWIPFIDLGVGAVRETISSVIFGVFIVLLVYRKINP